MTAMPANPKVARGLKRLYAQLSEQSKVRAGARLERDIAIIEMGAVPAEDDGAPAQPVTDADLIQRLSQFFASDTTLPSKLWPTDTLRQALTSFFQSVKNEADASRWNSDRESPAH
jgi:hypothetical protein